jgi:hypothetical protein
VALEKSLNMYLAVFQKFVKVELHHFYAGPFNCQWNKNYSNCCLKMVRTVIKLKLILVASWFLQMIRVVH